AETAVAVRRARGELDAARRAEAEASRALDAHDERMTASADSLNRLTVEQGTVATEQAALHSHLAEQAAQVGRDEARAAELDGILPALEAEEAAGAERVEAM